MTQAPLPEKQDEHAEILDLVERTLQVRFVKDLGMTWPEGKSFYEVVGDEMTRLRKALAESESENDQWEKKLEEVWREQKKLNDVVMEFLENDSDENWDKMATAVGLTEEGLPEKA